MTFLLAITTVLSCVVISDEAIQIPKNQIWALNLPGTKNIYDLEDVPKGLKEEEFLRRSAILRMTRRLSRLGHKESDKAPVGFIVAGKDKQALDRACDIITGKAKRQEIFPADQELTLVFYSHATGRYVRLDEVERNGNDITIRYHLETKSTMDLNVYVALIPLEKLPADKYPVWVKRNPPVYGRGAQDGPASPKEVKRTISGSFEFIVAKQVQK